MPMQFDQEWLQAVSGLASAFSGLATPVLHDIQTVRNNIDYVVPYVYASWAKPEDLGITQEHHTYTSFDGATIQMLRFYKSQEQNGNNPPPPGAILYLYGGGFVAGRMEHYSRWATLLGAETDMPVFMVEYRKAPEYPHPYPVEDAYAGLQYLQEKAQGFNIDPARIALFGESAGSGLCAAVALVSGHICSS